ncbi:MAG: gliding motility-associated C-terminal domain-containing protein, partial [Firmicutes bacterium]|nr:gliding motility-associated C-terminal domain-containing protein [Bacillota bacterium]
KYEVCDDGSPVACSVAKVSIDVMEILPVAVPDFAITETNAPVQINVFENDSTTFDPNTIIITQAPNNGQTSSDGSGVIIYTPNDGFDGEDSFIYEICDEFNRCDTAIVTITIEKTLLLYEVFTPNGDGQNDTYVIDGIENYPDNRFIVYNRWGNIVYEKKGYMNEWDGSSNSSIAVGNKPLPAGTYFYVIEYSEEKRKTGFIYIYR